MLRILSRFGLTFNQGVPGSIPGGPTTLSLALDTGA